MSQLHRPSFLLVLALLWGSQSTAISLILTAKDAACGNSNGSIVVDVLNGSPPYTYVWSGGQTTQLIDNLAPGTYTVTVTDNLGSSATDFAIINNTTELTGAGLTYVIPPNGVGLSHPCNGQCNGIAYLSEWSMNGTPPYSMYTSMGHTIGYYAPANVQTVEGICSPDVYTVFVSDALGCTGTATPTFSYPYATFSHTQNVTASCNGANTGQVVFGLLENHMMGYDINWTGPTTGYDIGAVFLLMAGLLPGTYTVTMSNTYALAPCDTVFTVNVPSVSNCGTISGQVYADTIPNCIADGTEPLVPSRMVVLTPGPYYATSDTTGQYVAYLPYGTFDVSTVPNSNFTPVCTATGITLSAVNDSITGVDLGDSTETVLDLSVHLMSGPARPGFNYQLFVTVSNYSVVTVPGAEVILDFDTVLTFISCNTPYSVTGTDQLILQMPPIGEFGTVQAQLIFSIPPDPTLIGQQVINQATLNANQPEPDLSDNTDVLQQMITGSFDPNDKAVWPAFNAQHTYLVDVDTLLRYTIRFQNTGNDTAFQVVLVDTLSEFLDVTSFQVMGTSHPCTWTITGQNILRVTYANILLPDSNVNEPASHGMFSFTIQHTPALQQQVMPYLLENVAAIYFDFNPPIITNAAFNTVEFSVGLEETEQEGFSLYPNPARDEVLVICDDPSSIERIIITDLPGKRVCARKPDGMKTVLPLHDLAPGIYLVVVESANMRMVKKLVKE